MQRNCGFGLTARWAEGSAKSLLEILIGKPPNCIELIGFAVPQLYGWQGDPVEGVGLDHRVMRLIKECDPDTRFDRA